MVVIAFKALTPEGQEQVFGQLEADRLEQLAGQEGTTARSGAHLGEPPNSTSYRRAWRELRA